MTEQCNVDRPGACSLGPAQLGDRLTWIKDLNEAGLRSCRYSAGTIELVYETKVADQVRELVRRERECCGFLRFEVREDPNAVILRVEVPDDSRELMESVLAGRRPVAQPEEGRGCSS